MKSDASTFLQVINAAVTGTLKAFGTFLEKYGIGDAGNVAFRMAATALYSIINSIAALGAEAGTIALILTGITMGLALADAY